jgi:hypothetical protein
VHVTGVDQHDLKAALLEDFVKRNPINPVDFIATVFTPHCASHSASR